MVHAIEAFTSKRIKNPLSDMLAREALRLMAGNIETAVKQGDNLEARSAMLLGAMLAGQAFANAPVAAVHALAYPLGGNYHIPHGLSNSLVLPHVLRFNAPEAADIVCRAWRRLFCPGQTVARRSIAVTELLADYFLGSGCRPWVADNIAADEYRRSGFIHACARGHVAAAAADQ